MSKRKYEKIKEAREISNANLSKGSETKNKTAKEKHLGGITITTYGETIQITKYDGYKNIEVTFLRDNAIKKSSMDSFLKGNIVHPDDEKKAFEKQGNTRLQKARDKYMGFNRLNTKGFKYTVINYNGSHDVDVEFEDKTIVCHRDTKDVLSGEIKKPIK